jgi:uncharacterized protein
MLNRDSLRAELQIALTRSPAVVLLGPRQVGKTTLARLWVEPTSSNYFDLEDPVTRVRLSQPMVALSQLQGLVVIDEIQHAPELFKVLRVLIDRSSVQGAEPRARFLLLGSASPELLRQSGESLAGRIEIIEVGGFSLAEAGVPQQNTLWWRGGFPRSFTAASDEASRVWRRDFMRNVIERDMPQLGINVPATAMHRFFAMLAHVHGQVWNAADLARAIGNNESTVRRHLDWLSQLFMVRQLQPWFENLGKRQVKSPKVYFRDSGLLHQLLGINSYAALMQHPKIGASWEGFVIEQILRVARPDDAYFWATHAGAELDLLLFKNGWRVGVEIKRMDAPQMTPSMHTALKDLALDALYVVYPGEQRYHLSNRVQAVPLAALLPGRVAG